MGGESGCRGLKEAGGCSREHRADRMASRAEGARRRAGPRSALHICNDARCPGPSWGGQVGGGQKGKPGGGYSVHMRAMGAEVELETNGLF